MGLKEDGQLLGRRGFLRYYEEKYAPAFILELIAVKRQHKILDLWMFE